MTLSFLGKREKTTVSITIEHGVIKLLVCHGLEVVDYRVLLPNPRFFREGQVSNPARVAGLILNALPELAGDFQHALGAVPGFQNRLGLMHFPVASGFKAETIIPQEASRIMKVSSETYHLSWHRLSDRLERTRWLVTAASRRSITSLMETAEKSNIAVTTLELRPFPLARAVNQPDANPHAYANPDSHANPDAYAVTNADAGSSYSHAGSSYGHARSGYSHAGSSYGHAGSSYGHAGSSYGHAGSSYGHARSGDGHANTTYGHARSGYGHANTTHGHAGSSYGYARTTYGYANTTHGYANTTHGHARTTYGHANTTHGYANTTHGHAGSTDGHARTTYCYAGANGCRCQRRLGEQ